MLYDYEHTRHIYLELRQNSLISSELKVTWQNYSHSYCSTQYSFSHPGVNYSISITHMCVFVTCRWHSLTSERECLKTSITGIVKRSYLLLARVMVIPRTRAGVLGALHLVKFTKNNLFTYFTFVSFQKLKKKLIYFHNMHKINILS